MSMVSRVADDGADYYGPFGGRYVTQQLIDTIRLTFKLPGCNKKFPKDQGKERPCLNYHMNNCDGWCQLGRSSEQYRETMKQVTLLLQGKYKQIAQQLRQEMEDAAEALEFERAAAFRDRVLSIENLGKKQLVTAGTMAHTDVIGYYEGLAKACFAVLHYVDGNLLDKTYEIVPLYGNREEAVSSLVKQYYLSRNCVPKEILLPCEMEDAQLFSDLLMQNLKKRVHIRTPQRGDGVALVHLANKNAQEEAERITSKEERNAGVLGLLQELLGLPEKPVRMESYDISNTAGTDIVASMVVFSDGKPLKRDYRHFKINGLLDQDDYTSMYQVLIRRFIHYVNGDKGFEQAPSLLLIDGGIVHAQTAEKALRSLDLHFPVFGMVKDNRHRTRALVTADGREISIQAHPAVFALIGQVQEETHRFAIEYHRKLRSRHLKESALDEIPGIGPERKKLLLKRFRSVSAVEKASAEELIKVLGSKTGQAVYHHFHQGDLQ